MNLHHSGFIVRDINSWEKQMIFEEKLNDTVDRIQYSRLALYKNFGQPFIELIQPINEQSLSWNSLQKYGNHFNHFCYAVNSFKEMVEAATQFHLLEVLAPVPAILFNNKMVAFYYSRNRQLVEFLIDD